MSNQKLICPVERIDNYNSKIEIQSDGRKINIKTNFTIKSPLPVLVKWANKKIREFNQI